ncbi:MAG TPA: S53 family peptidase [Candidatus Dormibacteraeota bacterium]|nr:S53 family peptidase [Candidatus Dormibacteraeota bacterium]
MKIRAALLAMMVVVSACQSPGHLTAGSSPIPVPKPPPTLAQAIARATDLGPAGESTTVSLDFGLSTAHPVEAAVERAVALLNSSGLQASWRAPSSLIIADGPAPAAAALLQVRIEEYRMPDGTTFYATLDRPRLPTVLAAVSTDISGLDNYRHAHGYAVSPGGMRPADILAFYNLKALRDAGLDGTGQTILLPEIDDFNPMDIEAFASEFGLPAFAPLLTVKRDPSWGAPTKPQGETVLDLEIAHEVAPNAKLVVYLSADDFGHTNRAFDAMVTDHLGSIISESLGSCEPDTPGGVRNTYAAIQDRAIALHMSHFIASGDSGAFTCGQDQDAAASFPSTLPTVTAVGGTTVFESAEGVYFKEYSWSSPIDQSGSGGGYSQFYTQPDYQKNEAQFAGHGQRQVPDVAADGDPLTGFHIYFNGRDSQIGGTSASTPLWAGTAALINQDLKKKGLREIGFANPALYWMGENSAKLDPKPFHDVAAGNNLGYLAAPGWDFATGWGSMDAGALDTAWTRYIKSGGG